MALAYPGVSKEAPGFNLESLTNEVPARRANPPQLLMNQATSQILRGALASLLLFATAELVPAQSTAPDNLKARWMNYEVGTMNAFVFPPGSNQVYSLNQSGMRVIHFPATNPAGRTEIPVGPGTASIALRPGTDELWVTDRVTSQVLVIDIQTDMVVRSLAVANEPHMVLFTPSGDRAYVSCSGAGQVDVIDTASFAVVNSITIPSREPRGLALLGNYVYVVPLLSGNGSTLRGNPVNADATDAIQIRVPSPALGENSLPDRDLYAIRITGQASTDVLEPTYTTSGLGTVLFTVRARPGSSELWIPHTEALNAQFKGEKAFVGGQVVQNRIAIVDTALLGQGTNQDAVTIIDLDAMIPTDLRSSTPTDVAFTNDGSMAFVAGYGSDRIAVLSLAGPQPAWLGSIIVTPRTDYPDGAGPRSLAMSPDGQTLFVHNKGENALVRIPLAQLPSTPGFAYATLPGFSASLGWDPLPADIVQGRVHFNRTQNSLSNTSSCMNCHVDGHVDGVVWDLGGYLDAEGLAPDSQAFPIDNKGPLVSQSVRHLREIGPYHWRGEQKALMRFNDAFISLMERTENNVLTHLFGNMRYITQYMEVLAIGPNPNQLPDRSLTPNQAAGRDLFMNRQIMGSLTCNSCHMLPIGTAGEVTANRTGTLSPTTAVPSLREVEDKTSTAYVVGGLYGTRTESGIGYGHSGAHAVLEDLIKVHVAGQGQDLSNGEAFLLAEFVRGFDTGTPHAAAWLATATPTNAPTFRSTKLGPIMDQVRAGNCDLVYRYGPVQWQGNTVYMTGLFDPVAGDFIQSSQTLPRLSTNALLTIAAGGMPVTFIGTPPFMGITMGLDRDNDKLYDLDELLLGTNPENEDTDEDGFHDGYERLWQLDPLVFTSSSPDQTAPSVIGNIEIDYITTNAVKFEFHMDEPTRVLFSYNGGIPVLRAPLKPMHDTDFSIVVGELTADTVYDFEFSMTDLAGNVALPHVIFRTKAFVLPTPAHVSDLDLQLIRDALGSTNVELLARVTLEHGSGVPAVGYDVQARAYYATDDDTQQIDLGMHSVISSRTGRSTFRIQVPTTVVPGQGRIYFTVEHARPPAGGAVYAEGNDTPMNASIAY